MSKQRKITIALAVLLVIVIAAAGILYAVYRPGGVAGKKVITFSVINQAGECDVVRLETREKFLADALANEDFIEYNPSGLYDTIKGIKTDFNADGSWWCIYDNGNMATLGMNELPIVDGGDYVALYTVGFDQ